MKRKVDLLEFGIDPDQCCYCTRDKEWTDRYGLPWCEDHKHRGMLLDWGLQHQWPDFQCPPYAIGPGEFCWYIAAIVGTDEFVWVALSAVLIEAKKAS